MDRRRVTAPDNVVPIVFSKPAAAKPQASSQPKNSVRPFFVKTSVVDNANGSCYLEIDNTKIIVSVYGAKPMRGFLMSTACFSIATKIAPEVKIPAAQKFAAEQAISENETEYMTTESVAKTQLSSVEQKISTYLQNAFLPSILLEKYPKSSIEVYVNVLSNDNSTNFSLQSLMTWCANCVSLALVDSGLELRDVVATGIASKLDKTVIADPIFDSGNSNFDSLSAVVSVMATSDTVVGISVEGGDGVDSQSLRELIKGCKDMATEVRGNMNYFLSQQ